MAQTFAGEDQIDDGRCRRLKETEVEVVTRSGFWRRHEIVSLAELTGKVDLHKNMMRKSHVQAETLLVLIIVRLTNFYMNSVELHFDGCLIWTAKAHALK